MKKIVFLFFIFINISFALEVVNFEDRQKVLQDVKSIITQHCSDYGYPIVFDIDAGHHLNNMAIPFGVPVSFQNGILTFANS